MPAKKKAAGGEDPRQRRSKRRLSQALLGLLRERSYREISVVDICQRAMVHRTTFYTHFEDKNALFRYVLEEEIQEAAKSRPPATETGFRASIREELGAALRFCSSHRDVYLFGINGGYGELRLIEDRLAGRIQEMIRRDHPQESPLTAEFTGRFYAGSLMNVARWWMEKNIPLTEDEVLAEMERLLPRDWEEK